MLQGLELLYALEGISISYLYLSIYLSIYLYTYGFSATLCILEYGP